MKMVKMNYKISDLAWFQHIGQFLQDVFTLLAARFAVYEYHSAGCWEGSELCLRNGQKGGY